MRYAWTAVLSDGTELKQETCSFGEVEAAKNLAVFILENDQESFVLDLTTGEFTVNSSTFKLDNEGSNRELIFHRNHKVNVFTGEDKITSYVLGYKYIKDNKTTVRNIEIDE